MSNRVLPLALWIAVAAILVGSGAPAVCATLELMVSLTPVSRSLSARAVIALPAGAPTMLQLDRRFEVSTLAVNGRPLLSVPAQPGQPRAWRIDASQFARRVEVTWQGQLDALSDGSTHRDPLKADRAVADERGSFLPVGANWHPVLSEPFSSYKVSLDVPATHRGIVPGNLIAESEAGDRYRATFTFAHPIHGVDLMAGPYRVTSRDMRTSTGKPITVRTYFHPEIADLADEYINASQAFIDQYDAQIGPYPYSIFSVVSSPTPTGLGMPALTYLGVQVLRLPFIRETSLGHEVLHSWWGNGVFVDYARGNWSEGLTTFMADYAYREKAGAAEARAMRIDWLRDLAAIPLSEDRPLSTFIARHHGASQIVGYHKVAMIFLMLRDEIGHEAFDRALRRFWSEQQYRKASWEDILRTFEAVSKKELSTSFSQWLSRSGLPDIRISNVARESDETGHRVHITLAQSSPHFHVPVPIEIQTASGAEPHVLTLDAAEQSFILTASNRPTQIVLDPAFRVLRRLDASETPPILRQVMVNPETTLVILTADPNFRAAAHDLAKKFLDYPPASGDANQPPTKGPVLVITRDGDGDAWLSRHGVAKRPSEMPDSGSARVWASRGERGVPIVVITARDAEALATLARPLPHYGRQSWLVVDGQKVTHRGVSPARPQTLPIE
ncbi:MAG: M1 family metallopeptidase [Burkholderiales bacterium]